tara:strand:- start:843 stop:1136 length:294 start_codon:yes stop_codon:yes gene_type:complete
MRVRISYSVDLDDVPNECARMLQESLEHVGEIHREIESLIDKMDNTDGIGWQIKDQIDRARLRLAKLDTILADNQMILDGFYATKEPKEAEDVASEG